MKFTAKTRQERPIGSETPIYVPFEATPAAGAPDSGNKGIHSVWRTVQKATRNPKQIINIRLRFTWKLAKALGFFRSRKKPKCQEDVEDLLSNLIVKGQN